MGRARDEGSGAVGEEVDAQGDVQAAYPGYVPVDAWGDLAYVEDLSPGPWRCTYMLKPDVTTLEKSLVANGWLAPIIVNIDGEIIDGHERAAVARGSKKLRERDGGRVPVMVMDVDDEAAVVMHVRLNRARGVLQAYSLSPLVTDLISSGSEPEALRGQLGMSPGEFVLIGEGGLFTSRRLDRHVWSKAWVPVEAADGERVAIERPPNADR